MSAGKHRVSRRSPGQAIIEYILMTIMIAVTVAVVIRASNETIYQFWTGLARVVAIPCPECTGNTPPQLP